MTEGGSRKGWRGGWVEDLMNGGGCDWVSECAIQELLWLCLLFWSSWVMPAEIQLQV